MIFHSSAWAAPIVAAMQMDPLNTNSAISIGLMVTIIGAVIWLSKLAVGLTKVLTRSEEQLRAVNEKLADLKTIPERMALLEQKVGHVDNKVDHVAKHVETVETDVNNLWAAVRQEDGDLLDRTRRERGPRPQRSDHPHEGR